LLHAGCSSRTTAHANCSFRGAYWRGYTIDSQPDYKQLRRQVKADTIVSLVLIVGVTTLQAYVGAVVIGALLIAFYLGWMRYLLRGLHPSDARLSLQDSMASQARAHSVTGLWLLQIGALTFVALGILILVVDPDNWLVAFGSIVFLGLCAGFAARLLVLRRRTATGRP
jgi:hypothetical protein